MMKTLRVVAARYDKRGCVSLGTATAAALVIRRQHRARCREEVFKTDDTAVGAVVPQPLSDQDLAVTAPFLCRIWAAVLGNGVDKVPRTTEVAAAATLLTTANPGAIHE
ncbi:hypothetical protein LEL86_03840 [Streptomyces sp. WA6-1-16]|uniref:hypothetical protein n=1 Tax=Streptomyces sp. WA6-1-16 TaxID=2879427 RepID=UPI001CE3033C|nr:hypothetical protein [Streptomyces sp. WA6-1-16]UCA48467.1 hypothetical protein LEL86_03840 [Streptomyces sp. WA6-1-16]